MAKEMTYQEGEPFYYQIGDVSTLIPWWRPTYDRICKFLTDDEVIDILKKYIDVQIIGNCLWEPDTTWDLDLRLMVPNYNILEENPIWVEIESDLNKLNDLALNQWKILLDVGVTPHSHNLPTKTQILNSKIMEEEYKVKVDESWIAKIAYMRKVVGSEVTEHDLRNSTTINWHQLTEGHLVAYFPDFHSKKIVDKILNSNKEKLEHAISMNRFLEMGEEEFKNLQNY